MRKWISLIAFVACAAAHAQTTTATGCEGTTIELNACLNDFFTKTDQALGKIYALVVKELSAGSTDDTDTLENDEQERTLVAAERAWAKYKDAQCTAESARFGRGTGAPAAYAQCEINFTTERIRYLRDYAERIGWASKLCKANKADCALPPLTTELAPSGRVSQRGFPSAYPQSPLTQRTSGTVDFRNRASSV